MTRSLVIVGCGGFGREVWAMLSAEGAGDDRWEVEGFVDDHPSAGSLEAVEALGSGLIGSVADLAARRSPFSAVLAIGAPPVRQRVSTTLAGSRVSYPTIIHPDATVGRPVQLAEGVVIAPGARVSTNVTLGAHVHVDQNATIGHDTTIGAFSRLNPQACLSGSVRVGERVLVGANATVLQGVAVEDDAVVGASACVVRDVPRASVVKGVPAR